MRINSRTDTVQKYPSRHNLVYKFTQLRHSVSYHSFVFFLKYVLVDGEYGSAESRKVFLQGEPCVSCGFPCDDNSSFNVHAEPSCFSDPIQLEYPQDLEEHPPGMSSL